MRFKDPFAPRYGAFDSKDYRKKFAWLPLTTHDGYGLWLEHYWEAVFGGANTSFTSRIKYLEDKL